MMDIDVGPDAFRSPLSLEWEARSREWEARADELARAVVALQARIRSLLAEHDRTRKYDRVGRSLSANAYWWATVVPFFQDVWSAGRTPPYTKQQVHDVLVQVLIGCEDGPYPGSRLQKETHTMTAIEFAHLIDAAKQLAWDQYQAHIPEPGEGDI